MSALARHVRIRYSAAGIYCQHFQLSITYTFLHALLAGNTTICFRSTVYSIASQRGTSSSVLLIEHQECSGSFRAFFNYHDQDIQISNLETLTCLALKDDKINFSPYLQSFDWDKFLLYSPVILSLLLWSVDTRSFAFICNKILVAKLSNRC